MSIIAKGSEDIGVAEALEATSLPQAQASVPINPCATHHLNE